MYCRSVSKIFGYIVYINNDAILCGIWKMSDTLPIGIQEQGLSAVIEGKIWCLFVF